MTGTQGGGWGADVINMSHTEGSWYEVRYSCETFPFKMTRIVDIPGSGQANQVMVDEDIICPAGSPNIFGYGDAAGKQISGIRDSITVVDDEPIYPMPPRWGHKFHIRNSSRISGKMELTLTCVGVN